MIRSAFVPTLPGLLLVALSGSVGAVAAQNPTSQNPVGWEAVHFEVERERLVQVRQELESIVMDGSLSADRAREAQFQLDVATERLARGDFREGDRFALVVRGEEELTDTFTVMSGPVVRLPVVGNVSLEGVLASELEDHLRTVISEVLRAPEVQARAMLQIQVSGEVANPGFYLVTADALVSGVIMMAGGPTTDAKIDEVEIQRGPWRPDAPVQSLADVSLASMSVNTLGLRGGDRIMVPSEGGVEFGQILQWAAIIASTAASIVILSR